jgi:hypothetical protein
VGSAEQGARQGGLGVGWGSGVAARRAGHGSAGTTRLRSGDELRRGGWARRDG